MSRADDEKVMRDRIATIDSELAIEAKRKARLERQLAELDEGVNALIAEREVLAAEVEGPDPGTPTGLAASIRRILRDRGPSTIMEIARELVGTVEVKMGAQAAKKAGRETKTVLRDKNAYSDVHSAIGSMYRGKRVTRAKSDRGTVYALPVVADNSPS